MSRFKTIATLATLALTGAAVASVDTAPKPGGVYRMKPGIYVQQGVACQTAPNAAILQYDGRGLSDPHSRACRARILSRHGNRYDVRQSCIDAGAGPAPRVTERQTVTVSDALAFTLRKHGRDTDYRYCPISMRPAGIHGLAQ